MQAAKNIIDVYRVLATWFLERAAEAEGKPLPALPETIPLECNDRTALKFEVVAGETHVANFEQKSGCKVARPASYQTIIPKK